MRNKYTLFLALLLLTSLWACVSEPEYPNEPFIEYLKISKKTVQQGDSVLLTFTFTDGDGDLGKKIADNADCGSNNCEFDSDTTCFKDAFYSCFIIDLRDSCFSTIALPELEPDGSIKAISGEIDIVIPPIFCKCNPCTSDEVSYEIVVKDAAGNYSNTITSESITVTCN